MYTCLRTRLQRSNFCRLLWPCSSPLILTSTSSSRSARAERSSAPSPRGSATSGIVAEPINPAEELETFPFAEDRLILITPRRHALSSKSEIAFRDILDHEFIGLAEGSALQKTLNHHAARTGRRLKLRVRLNSFDSVARMVESGIGVAVLPESAARRCRRSMAIRIVPLTDGWAARHFTICVRGFRCLSPHAKWLVEYLTSHAPSA